MTNRIDVYEMYRLALKYAATQHKDQQRWDGTPYIVHPVRVSSVFDRGSIESIVALLHDVIEDTNATEEIVRQMFGDLIGDAVVALTKIDGEEYQDYLERVAKNAFAIEVKIADIEDNLNDNPEKLSEKKKIKYRNALDFLCNSLLE